MASHDHSNGGQGSVCAVPVQEITNIHTVVGGSNAHYAALGSDVTFPVLPLANESYVVFSADLPMKAREIIVGGGMVVQLRVSFAAATGAETSDNTAVGGPLVEFLQSVEFSAAVRAGGYPDDPYASLESEFADGEALASNAFVLWSQDAQVVDSGTAAHQSSDDDSGDARLGPAAWELGLALKTLLDRASAAVGVSSHPRALMQDHLRESSGAHSSKEARRYSWSVSRAVLPKLFTPWPGATSGAAPLFLRVTAREAPSNCSMKPPTMRSIGNLSVSLSLVFEPCPAGSCAHGTCYTRRQGDIAASTCACRYVHLYHNHSFPYVD
jgi:hypothetical protein